jgi:nucleoid-associated protein YgaU
MERVTMTERVTQARAQMTRLTPCLETARQAIHAAEVAGTTAQTLAPARGALASAEVALEHAEDLLAAGDVERAISRLETALSDCFRAQELLGLTTTTTAQRMLEKPERYTVERGDTLWGISARDIIYNNPLMWPMIYKANRQQIRDPDLIFPKQILAIPRDYSPAEAEAAIRRARQRSSWRLGDSR